jgi:hypothetical protein
MSLAIRFASLGSQEVPTLHVRSLECKSSQTLSVLFLAYTCRVDQVGLIPRDNHQQVPFAYHMYSRDDKTGWEQSIAFKKAFSLSVDIEFVGVWYVPCGALIVSSKTHF